MNRHCVQASEVSADCRCRPHGLVMAGGTYWRPSHKTPINLSANDTIVLGRAFPTQPETRFSMAR